MAKNIITPKTEQSILEIMAGQPRPENGVQLPVMENDPQEDSQTEPDSAGVKEPAVKPPVKRRREKQDVDYAALYFVENNCPARIQTYIDRRHYDKIKKNMALLAPGLSFSSFINNVLQHHLESNQDEINEMVREKLKEYHV